MLTPLPPSVSLFNNGNALSKQPNLFQANDASQLKSKNALNGLSQQRDSFAVFNDILQKAYKKMAFSPTNNPNSHSAEKSDKHSNAANIGQYQKVNKISSEQAADTILNFISQKLKMDEANGADKEALLNRLDQGLQGFVKGFNEAKDQIEAMGLLTPNLALEINDTYERVTKGVEDLRNAISGNQATKDVANVNKVRLAGEASESRSFSLELTTQDGDKVVIDISRNHQTSFSAEGKFSTSSKLNFQQQSASSSSFNLNVTGDLDDDELTAINKLLQDVDKIAGNFFAGDLDRAFEQALTLDINREELSSLNLQLQKTTTVKALAAYESTARAQNGASNDNLTLPVKDLNQLFNDIQNILTQARKFIEPLRLISDVANGVSSLSNENNSQNQLADLNEKLNQLVSKFNL